MKTQNGEGIVQATKLWADVVRDLDEVSAGEFSRRVMSYRGANAPMEWQNVMVSFDSGRIDWFENYCLEIVESRG